MADKNVLDELALFGGEKAFCVPKSTSNLVRPDFQRFLEYSSQFYKQRQFTNNGPLVKLLEKRLAQFHQTEFCITFCSGFWALAIAVSEMSLTGRNEIVMPALTYRRMADIAAWAKLIPHFCEVESSTLSVSPDTVRKCINENTALILGVHPMVNCCDVDGLIGLSKEKNVPLLFDSVESVYESIASGKVGSFGDAEVFSMHASKLINGFEGGYITTNNERLASRLALLRGFGFKGADHVAVQGGMNAKLNEIHAAMALASLDDLEHQVLRNRERYYMYRNQLATLPGIRLLEFDERHKTSYKNIVVELLDEWPLSRADTLSIMNSENILARAYYYPPLHRKKMEYASVPVDLPNTDFLANRYMLLPCGHFVDSEDISRVTELLKFIQKNALDIKDRLQKIRFNENT